MLTRQSTKLYLHTLCPARGYNGVYEINIEVAGSICQTVKAAQAMLKEHKQSLAYGEYCKRLGTVH